MSDAALERSPSGQPRPLRPRRHGGGLSAAARGIFAAGLLLAAVAVGAESGPVVAGCRVFPADNVWNVRVDGLPVHARSAEWVAAIGRQATLGHDFVGGGAATGSAGGRGSMAISEVVRPAPLVDVELHLPEVSDPGPYPIPDPPWPGALPDGRERHLLLVDAERCTLYELSAARWTSAGWSARAAAVFDLRSNDLRTQAPVAGASGLPILPGLVRYDEAESGAIRHAVRFTAPRHSGGFEWPARAPASETSSPQQPPTGQRFRLRRDLDLSGYAPRVRAILVALQRYGMVLADVGAPWSLSAAPDARWKERELAQLAGIRGADFEAVDVAPLRGVGDTGRALVAPERPPVALAAGTPFDCVPAADVACVDRGRFEVRVAWTDAEGVERPAIAADAGSRDTSLFWFFEPLNWELMVKVIDGCAVNGHHWVFFAGTTDLGFSVSVSDTRSGERRVYRNPAGEPAAAVTDSQAFAECS
ncbi:MAG TPA: hypothetical protein VMV46_09605 [Thermoanaerobaculia bacterium]|nr:hypothetical protein [Thermoanaerobaculia bacterium]